MSGSSAIEWTDATWNPVTGCTRVSPGCAHCYIERTPPFRMEGRRFTHGADGATTGLRLHDDRLEQPLRWRKPRRVFVNSLSDLFHEHIPYEFIREVFNTMRRCDGGVVAATGKRDPSHVFQVLTKRPERALELWRDRKLGFVDWPAHIWLGVSVENARFTWRADVLREIPAAVRFISAEPLLGSLFEVPGSSAAGADPSGDDGDPEDEPVGERQGRQPGTSKKPLDLSGIDWVIVGGESGPGARPMHPDWAREIRDACLYERDETGNHRPGPAFFFKQWGEWTPAHQWNVDIAREHRFLTADGRDLTRLPLDHLDDATHLVRVGKKRAGRELDGSTWDEFPEARR